MAVVWSRHCVNMSCKHKHFFRSRGSLFRLTTKAIGDAEIVSTNLTRRDVFFAVFVKSLTAFCQICNLVNEPRIRPLLTICKCCFTVTLVMIVFFFFMSIEFHTRQPSSQDSPLDSPLDFLPRLAPSLLHLLFNTLLTEDFLLND